MKIWVDADACPRDVKELVFKTSFKKQIEVCLVANQTMHIPPSPLISMITVEKGADVADFYIVEHLNKGDLVITADIPLAALVVEKEAIGINPRGEMYTEENVQERLSVRDFMQDLRDSGLETSGPAPYGPKDKAQFANTLNRILSRHLR